VEDAAQAHLAIRDGHAAGATIGAFSLYATKNMMTGEGGVVTTNDAAVDQQLRLFRNHGMPQRYRHTEWGLNLRLTDLQGAIGRTQLAKLPAATARRIENAKMLDSALPEFFRRPPRFEGAHHVFHQYTVAVPAEHRQPLVESFREAGVGVEVYYPEPIHHQPAFREHADPASCPRATEAAKTVISIPVHPAVTSADIDYIGEVAHTLAGNLR
ncbi:MAG: aminotransferase DegT, partial [Acidimicrobiia bacterium]|nr:aminotransferase DegT [Acidimicrobiia bacterium]